MSKKRLYFLTFILVAGFGVVIIRLYYIQIIKHKEMLKITKSEIYKMVISLPLRGEILDRNHTKLVFSIYKDTCFVDPNFIDNPAQISEKLSDILKINYSGLIKKISDKSKSFVVIKKHISQEESKKIASLKLKGVGLIPEQVRVYPNDKTGIYLLGKVGVDATGLWGLENEFDDVLKGKVFKSVAKRDALGNILIFDSINPDNLYGNNLLTTIDLRIQYICDEILKNVFKKYSPKMGILLLQNPKNGEILACSVIKENENYKSYLVNPVVSYIFEPGSTFKIVPLASILMENIIGEKEKINCENGSFKLFGHEIKDHQKHSFLTLNEIVKYSSNIGFAKLGLMLKKENLYTMSLKFGFGNYTSIKLPGEAKGLLNSPDKWSEFTPAAFSYGYEVGVTPIQLICAYSAVANGGFLLEPKIIKEIQDHKGNVIFQEKKTVVRRVIPSSIVSKIKNMLKEVVETGTGIHSKVEGLEIAGKTGTAEKLIKGKYSQSKHIASFCGFYPFDNPQVTILVILDEPKGNFWGGVVAAPVFKDVVLATLPYFNVKVKKNYVAKKDF